MKPLRIAFSGKAGAGKDYACAYLIEKYLGTRLAFADALVGGCKALHHYYGFGYEKDRELLQTVGDWARRRDPHVFIRDLCSRLDECGGDNVFVSDLRMRDEAIALRGIGFVLVRIDNRESDKVGAQGWQAHKSELELDAYDGFDYRVTNCKVDTHFEDCLDVIVTAIKEGRHTWSPHQTIKIA